VRFPTGCEKCGENMKRGRLGINISVATIAAILLFSGCRTKPGMAENPDKKQIATNLYKMFTRLKVGDKLAIYDNEFPYLHEEADIETFLKHPLVVKYRTDTLLAVQIDSIKISDSLFGGKENATVYAELEWFRSDSSLSITKPRLIWYKHEKKWIMPRLSSVEKQNQFDEDMKIYWEAVKEKEREQSEGDSTDSSGK
jgi:hypothetical protein